MIFLDVFIGIVFGLVGYALHGLWGLIWGLVIYILVEFVAITIQLSGR